jgi:acetyl-CoA/propionyl-CoA carboxylase, biotin carboxylase, biotin carboxyl carrier protein
VIAGPDVVEVIHRGQRHVFPRPSAGGSNASAITDGVVVAPMPGTVAAIRVAVGDLVTVGQTLGMLEAMKMELPLAAPCTGAVVSIDVATGQQVALGGPLFVIDSAVETSPAH